MSVIETRVRDILRQAEPLAARLPKHQLDKLIAETFGDQFTEPDPPAKISYQAANGLVLNVHPERRGNNLYWFCNKQHRGTKHRLYIAPAGKLSKELLENAAIQIEANSVTVAAATVTN
jgi:hypothetical protein